MHIRVAEQNQWIHEHNVFSQGRLKTIYHSLIIKVVVQYKHALA